MVFLLHYFLVPKQLPPGTPVCLGFLVPTTTPSLRVSRLSLGGMTRARPATPGRLPLRDPPCTLSGKPPRL